MRLVLPAVVTLLAAGCTPAFVVISFPTPDGGRIHADRYGHGTRAVVLAHGGQFTKESWREQAPRIADAGFCVLAIDFRGRGKSRGPGAGDAPRPGTLAPVGIRPHHLDVLAAVRYLRRQGAVTVSVVGASIGGGASAQASCEAEPGEIDRLVLLAPAPIEEPEHMTGRKLFITSSGDPRVATIRDQFERAPEPKTWIELEGSAHAQHVFATDQGERMLREILRFLTEP